MVYDLFHVGHLNISQTAKKYCEYLIVGVHGGDVAEINRFRDKLKLWELYHFDVVFIGDDWKGTERWNNFEKVLAEFNVDVVYVSYTKVISTTDIREKIMNGDNI